MNQNQFDKNGRRDVTEDHFEAALKAVFLAPKGSAKSENREPTKDEIAQRWRLDRRKTNDGGWTGAKDRPERVHFATQFPFLLCGANFRAG